MPNRRYAVVQVGDEWRIVGELRQIGHFRTRAEATMATVRLGALAEQEGCSVELLVQERFGELRSFAAWDES